MKSRHPGTEAKGLQKPLIPHSEPAAGTGSARSAQPSRDSGFKRFLKVLGPGFITGASDDDPSGIGTYSTAGASLGFVTLWLALITFPLMAVVQFICAEVGLVTGRGLSGVIKRHYSGWVLYPVVIALVVANTINAGADIGAIAAAINLLVPAVPIVALIVPIAIVILVLQIWGSYRLIANIFRWLTLSLLAYIVSAFFSHPDLLALLKGTFIPTLRWDSTFLATVIAILGTTISPYLFFWQSDQEVEEQISMGKTSLAQRRGANRKELKAAGLDVGIGMFFSNMVMYFIILATAATLFKAGKHDIQSATDAAAALRPLAGNVASLLLAIGLIGSGFLAVPVLTGSAAYAISEAFGWQFGLEKNWRRAKQFYAIIIGATLIGMLINFVGINPIQALFWSAVINGVLAPPLLILLMLIANNRQIMGKHVNGWKLNLLGWLTTLLMTAAALVFCFMLVTGQR